MTQQRIIIAVMAHNEERRIAACLASLPTGRPDVEVHCVVNGSSDRTAEIASGFIGVTVHDYAEGGKSRSWNRFMFDTPGFDADCYIFVDGDARIIPGSIEALVETLADNPLANAAAGMPANGRKADAYRAEMLKSHGLFGDLYALSGDFVRKMRVRKIRLPEDLVGDDGLIGAMAKTDLKNEDDWQDARVIPCPQAGFLCEPASLLSPRTLHTQYRRMVNYSTRHFQNRIISSIMRSQGPVGLPNRLATLYPDWLRQFAPRASPIWYWFDRQALGRMASAVS